MIPLNARRNLLMNRRYAVIVLACFCALAFQGFTSIAAAQTSSPKASVPFQKAKPEVYHTIDSAKVGFTIQTQMSSMTRNAMGEIVDGEISELLLVDLSAGSTETAGYPVALKSNSMSDGKIHTADFGVFLVSAPGNFNMAVKMTDSQIKKIQAFLKAKKH